MRKGSREIRIPPKRQLLKSKSLSQETKIKAEVDQEELIKVEGIVVKEMTKKRENKKVEEIVKRSNKNQRVDKSKVRCYSCNKFGNYAHDCRKRIYDRGKKRETITT